MVLGYTGVEYSGCEYKVLEIFIYLGALNGKFSNMRTLSIQNFEILMKNFEKIKKISKNWKYFKN